MKIEKIVRQVNTLIGNGLYTYLDLEHHLDSIVVQINKRLSAKFPLFSTASETKDVYDYFPDDYIISVVIPGTAAKLLETEDEFESQYRVYMSNYNSELDDMALYYINQIPEEYQKEVNNTIIMRNAYGFSGNPFTGVSNNVYYDEKEAFWYDTALEDDN